MKLRVYKLILSKEQIILNLHSEEFDNFTEHLGRESRLKSIKLFIDHPDMSYYSGMDLFEITSIGLYFKLSPERTVITSSIK